MKNTFGHHFSVTLFGESHGPLVGATLDGCPAGVPVKEETMRAALIRRLGDPELSTARREAEEFSFVSGVKDGYTTGAPVTVLIPNKDVKNGDYTYENTPRPGHADLTATLRYGKFADLPGGGHFSGRLTAPLVAIGEIAKEILGAKGCAVLAEATDVGGQTDPEKIRDAVLAAKADGDSLGGIVSVRVTGVPAGIGEPFFDSAESVISHAVFSIPGVKGIAFGDGFALARMRGSEANDGIGWNGGAPRAASAHAGGIFGGITDGSDIFFTVAVKPTPSIAKAQTTVDLAAGTEAELRITGRHDPAFVLRTPPVFEAVTAIALCDLLMAYGGEKFVDPRN